VRGLQKAVGRRASPRGVSYIMIDRDGHADYTRDPALARKWKTLKGARKWLDVRGGYGGYTVTAMDWEE
jgi:hypothetical protein